MKDFFISYNKSDVRWAKNFHKWLKEVGYSCIIQEVDFQPGSNFVLEIDAATKAARRTIAVLSPNYLNAIYTQPEWTACFAKDPTGTRRLLIPVRIQECNLTGLLAQIVYIDLVGLEVTQARERFLKELCRLEGKTETSQQSEGTTTNSSKQLSEKFSIPVLEQLIIGDSNIQIGGNFIYTPKQVKKNLVQPRAEDISELQAHEIRRLIGELAEIDKLSDRRSLYGKWYTKLYSRFKVTSYKTIPSTSFDEVMTWLHQQVAQERRKLRRTDNPKWRTQLYSAIFARSKQLGLSKDELYSIANQRLRLKSPISSLTELGERNLKKMYDIIFRMK